MAVSDPDGDLVNAGSIGAPAQMFVFVEEHPESIDDGAFETTAFTTDQTWW